LNKPLNKSVIKQGPKAAWLDKAPCVDLYCKTAI
jgi:hypothetical protein